MHFDVPGTKQYMDSLFRRDFIKFWCLSNGKAVLDLYGPDGGQKVFSRN
jgi:hypothetical protein